MNGLFEAIFFVIIIPTISFIIVLIPIYISVTSMNREFDKQDRESV